MTSNFIELPVRQYSAVPTSNPRGLVTETWRLDLARTALISLHCWNIGVPGGIPVPEDYWVFMGFPRNHELMNEIVEGVIAPLLVAARRSSLPVVHVQIDPIADRYPTLRPTPPPPVPPSSAPQLPRVTNDWARHVDVTHGVGMTEWPGWDQADIAPAVKPEAGDTVVAQSDEFDGWLRARGIDTLLYTGFATNLCIQNSPGAMKAMRDRGYRCIILREATLGCEFPETMESLNHTHNAIRYIETWVGYSASGDDLERELVAASSNISMQRVAEEDSEKT